MRRPICGLPAACLGLLAALFALSAAAGAAAAFVAPDASADYSIPLRQFDLWGYSSPVVSAAGEEATRGFAERTGGEWKLFAWNPQTNTPHFLYGSGVQVAGSLARDDDAIAAARSVIERSPETFGASLEGLRVTDVPSGMGKRAVHFQQVHDGIDVYGARVRLTFTDEGRLFVAGSDCYRDIRVRTVPSIPAGVAREIAIRALPPFDPASDSVEEATELLILPVPQSETEVEHHLVWRTRVHVADPVGIWVTFVDAHNGEIVWRYNDVCFVDYTGTTSGMVQRPSYCEGQQLETMPYLRIKITGLSPVYADVSGNWTVPYAGTDSRSVSCDLYSPYVDLNNVAGAEGTFNGTATPGTPLDVHYDDSNSQRDEKDVYRAVNDIHIFYQDIHPAFGYINSRITANVSLNDVCNAFWNGSINFFAAGGGCANTGEIMGIVQHEYGHGINNAILGSQGNEGLGEGNSDVIANLMTLESIIGRGFGLDNCTAGIRNSENTLRYPEDVVNQEIHDAGRVIAGFHWDALQALMLAYGTEEGRLVAALDWHFGRVLEHPMYQPDQVLATFIADDDDGDLFNGTPNYDAFCEAAFNHGFDCPETNVGVFITYEPISSRTEGGDVPITAQIFSTNGALVADSLVLRYSVNGAAYATLVMQPTGGADEFSASILGLAPLDEVQYYLRARNENGNTKTAPLHAPPAYYAFDIATTFDDFEAAGGWVVNLEGTDNATQGIWVSADPVGTSAFGDPVQTEDDHTHSPGVICWVTGNGTPGGLPDDSDVDGGKTQLYSPVYDLTGADVAKAKFWRWFTNNQGSNPNQDAWRVQARNNGGAWQDIEYTINSANSWTFISSDLVAKFGASIGQVQFKFWAQDIGPVSLVEAAVDDFEILAHFSSDAPPASGSDTARFAFFGGRPNPARGPLEIGFQLPARGEVRLSLYSVAGRLVRDLGAEVYAPGVHHVAWDGRDAQGREASPGVYYARIQAGEFTATRTVVLAK